MNAGFGLLPVGIGMCGADRAIHELNLEVK
jgi:hypothetical protein